MLAISPDTQDFGLLALGGTSPVLTFTVTNGGESPSGGLSGTLAGLEPDQFEILVNNCSAPLQAHKTCTVLVVFKPTLEGKKTATLNVSADPGGAVASTLEGTGEPPPAAALTISSSVQDFGSIALGASSASVALNVNNTGGSPSGVPLVELTGADALDFSLTANACANEIAPESYCSVSVKFAPLSLGNNKTATLTVTATPGGTVTTTLTGKVTALQSLTIEPTPNDFGAVVVGEQSPEVTFTVENTGAVSSGPLTATLAGSNPTQFLLGANGCTTLAAGSSCVLTARFLPTSVGAKSASLSVSSTQTGNALAALTGTGISTAALSITPAVSDYGAVALGSTSTASVFEVKNIGGVATSALATALGGTGSGSFAIAADGCQGTVLAPLATCSMTVRFAPTALGATSATVTASALGALSATANLSGSGVTPAALSISPTAKDFLSVAVGSLGTATTFTVTNTGTVTSGALTPSVSGANPADFPIVSGGNNCLGATLAGGASCTLSVNFGPTAAGVRAATLSVISNPGGATSAALSGTGLSPAQLTAAPLNKDFGSVAQSTASANAVFTVTNSGGIPAGLPAVALTGTHPSEFNLFANGCTAPLAAGGSCAITVRFSPTGLGAKSATLSVTASPGGSLSIPLMGQGATAAALTLGPTPQDFGDQMSGTQGSVVDFTVTNGGGATSGPITFSLTGTNADQFALATPVGTPACASGTTPLVGLGTCRIGVRFAPTAGGAQTASLSVAGTPGGTVTAALSGNGLVQTQLNVVTPVLVARTFNFPQKPLGTTTPQTFKWRNTSATSAVALTGALLGGAGAAQYVISSQTCNVSLAANAECTVEVAFKPTLLVTLPATVSLGGAGTGGADVLNLTGSGASALSVVAHTAGEEAYGALPVGSPLTHLFDVSCAVGTGAAGCGMITTTLSGSGLSEFAVTSDTCAGNVLASGAGCSISVVFFPGSVGTGKTSTLSVAGQAFAGNTASVNLTGSGTVADTLSVAATTAFPTTQGIGFAITRTITVTNAAGAATSGPLLLAIAGASGLGAGSGEFAITGGTCLSGVSTLAAAASCNVVVTYTPSVAGPAAATTLKVTASPGTRVLGIYSSFTATAVSPLTISPSIGNFGNVPVGTTSGNTLFSVYNSGSGPTGALAVALAGSDSARFTLDAATTCSGLALSAGGSCIVAVKFSPLLVGMYYGPVDLTVSDPSVPGRTATATPLSGTGSSASAPANLTLTPSSQNFGSVVFGVPPGSGQVVFTVTNSGDSATANLGAPQLGGTNPIDFVASTTCNLGYPLASKSTCTISIRFSPAGAGDKSATVTLSSAGAAQTTGAIALTGLAVASGGVAVSPSPDGFGNAVIGSEVTRSYTLKNNGAAPATLFPVLNPPGGPGGDFELGTTTCVSPLAASAQCTVAVKFHPQSAGLKTVKLESGNGAPSSYSGLYGTGVPAPLLTFTPSAIPGPYDFSSVPIGTTKTQVFTIANSGASATGGAVTPTLGGTDPGQFAISSSTCTAALAAGQTCLLGVRFAPTTLGAKSATVTLTAAGTSSAQQIGNLAGTGAQTAVLSMLPAAAQAFGDVAVGSAGAAVLFTVSNAAGAATSGAIGHSFSGTDPAEFTLDTSWTGAGKCYHAVSPVTLTGGSSCTYKVNFAPRTGYSPGARSASFNVTGTPGGTMSNALTGSATSALSFSGGTPWAPSQAVGSAASNTFTVSNGAPVATGPLSVVLGGAGVENFSVSSSTCASASVVGSGVCSITVKYTPRTVGSHVGTLTVSGTPGNSASITFSGAGS